MDDEDIIAEAGDADAKSRAECRSRERPHQSVRTGAGPRRRHGAAVTYTPSDLRSQTFLEDCSSVFDPCHVPDLSVDPLPWALDDLSEEVALPRPDQCAPDIVDSADHWEHTVTHLEKIITVCPSRRFFLFDNSHTNLARRLVASSPPFTMWQPPPTPKYSSAHFLLSSRSLFAACVGATLKLMREGVGTPRDSPVPFRCPR